MSTPWFWVWVVANTLFWAFVLWAVERWAFPWLANRRHRRIGWADLAGFPWRQRIWNESSARWAHAASDVQAGEYRIDWTTTPDDHALFHAIEADKAWLKAQRELCEAEPADHSSWWEVGRG